MISKQNLKSIKFIDCSYFLLQATGNDDRHTLNALWGKLGSEILMQNWETALEDLNRLKDVIESNVSGTLITSFFHLYLFNMKTNNFSSG